MENEIEATLRSTIEQTYADNEIIVIDGASTDDTVAKALRLLRPQDILVSEPDAGIYDAMNKGIALATGTVVNFMNAGDIFENVGVIDQVANAWGKNDRIVYGIGEFKTLEPNRSITIGRNLLPQEYRKGRFYCHQAEFIDRHLFNEIGVFDDTFRIAGDIDFRLRAVKFGVCPRFVPVHVSTCGLPGLSQGDGSRFFGESARAIKKNFGRYWAWRYVLAQQVSLMKRILKSFVQ